MIAIGKILRPWGIKGELKVKPYNEDAFVNLKKAYIDGQTYVIKKLGVRMGYAYILLDEFDTPDKAEFFRDKEIFADKSVLGILADDEYLIGEMIGLLVVDDTGAEWGKIVSIEQYGSADIYTVVGVKGENRFPFLKDIVKDINFESKTMTVYLDKLSEVVVCG